MRILTLPACLLLLAAPALHAQAAPAAPADVWLVRYEARLAESPSLAEILQVGRPRVVNNLDIFRHGPHPHTSIIAKTGFHFSYLCHVSLRR